jgi:hypothetical protein
MAASSPRLIFFVRRLRLCDTVACPPLPRRLCTAIAGRPQPCRLSTATPGVAPVLSDDASTSSPATATVAGQADGARMETAVVAGRRRRCRSTHGRGRRLGGWRHRFSLFPTRRHLSSSPSLPPSSCLLLENRFSVAAPAPRASSAWQADGPTRRRAGGSAAEACPR